MTYRALGSTGARVSEVGFGAWAIGGDAYGKVERGDALRALARAESFGCNLVDTASVYGDSELVIGEFLRGRRDRWVLATKYSGQPQGMTATLENQLRRLRTEAVDLYQIHWAPRGAQEQLYEELYALKRAGKIRWTGVSLYSTADIDYLLSCQRIDVVQVAFSLLDPQPLLGRLRALAAVGAGVLVRSCLKCGFLTGKFAAEAVFHDPHDQRSRWSRREIASTARKAQHFAFVARECGSMTLGAARYPLSFGEVSALLLGTKTEAQAAFNFGEVPGGVLAPEVLRQVQIVQRRLRPSWIGSRLWPRLEHLWRRRP